MRNHQRHGRAVSVGIPEGKYCLIPVKELCGVWTAYRQGQIEFSDLRIWLAAHEMVERRCTLARGRTPAYNADELAALTGGSQEVVGSSLRRLRRARLLEFSSALIELSPAPMGDELASMLAQVNNNKRKIPMQRRLIRYLARSRQPAVVATALAMCLRGMYLRGRECHGGGSCKASWVADVFGVSIRSVRRARQELESISWSRPVAKPHWHCQRYGESFTINFAWSEQSHGDLSPRASRFQLRLSPPESHRSLPSEEKHNQPVAELPAAYARGAAKAELPSPSSPNLRAIQPQDLAEPDRLQVLWQQAVASGLIQRLEANRVAFFAAACRSRRIGKSNPCGLFSAILHRRLWATITLVDEDAARPMLRVTRASESAMQPTHRHQRVPLLRQLEAPRIGDAERQAIRDMISRSLGSVGIS